MNFVFISPQFPTNYYLFCRRLKENGLTVLGIGDTPYEQLNNDVKTSLTEYYRVDTLENYDNVYNGVAYFQNKYGKINFIESNNEYWLRQDAKLRKDFDIPGPMIDDVIGFTSKSKMKDFYIKANVPVARYQFQTTKDKDMEFIKTVGYPVIVKPDVGVGASTTYKINNENDYDNFIRNKDNNTYILEEYIIGDTITFDGLCDSNSDVLFCDSMVMGDSLMDSLNNNLEVFYYVNKKVPDKLYEVGQKVIKAFNIKSRYFHLEFFKLKYGKKGLGESGDIVALEVNMRPPGGFSPDMINISQSTDTYQAYADIISYDKIIKAGNSNEKYYCVYIGRRNRYSYRYTYDELKEKFNSIVLHDYMNECFQKAMGNEFFIAKFQTFDEVIKFKNIVLEKNTR